jgi:hypothetical protein
MYFCFVEYLPEDGRKRSKHVEGLPHVCILLYIIIVQLLEYIRWLLVIYFLEILLNVIISSSRPSEYSITRKFTQHNFVYFYLSWKLEIKKSQPRYLNHFKNASNLHAPQNHGVAVFDIPFTLALTVYIFPSTLEDFSDGMSQSWQQFWILSIDSFLKIHKGQEIGSSSVSRRNGKMKESTPLALQKELVLNPARLRVTL